MIHEIEARTLLSHNKTPDSWFGVKYNMNIYRGCQHRCIYCDSRSECYKLENFDDVLVKINALDLLRRELASKRVKGTVGTGSMSDPYGPVESQYRLTGQALQIISEFGFPLHLLTKSDLVVRDLDTLQEINERTMAVVGFTLTTVDDDLARRIEPGAPLPSARLRAMAALAQRGVHVGAAVMPVLPFIEDSTRNMNSIIRAVSQYGGEYILYSMGVTLRDRQRDYFYARLDEEFPGIKAKYMRAYGERYECRSLNWRELERTAEDECARLGLQTCTPKWQPSASPDQLSLF